MNLPVNRFNPHTFLEPSLAFYVIFFSYSLFYLVGRLTGGFQGLSDFIYLYTVDKSSFTLLARLLIACSGILTVALLYYFVKRLFGRKAALVSAALLSVNLTHIKVCQYVNLDLLMTMFLLAAFIFIVNVYRGPRIKDYLLAGIFSGLAFSTKYTAFLIVVPFFFAHLLSRDSCSLSFKRRLFSREVSLFALALSLAFLATSPYILLDFKCAIFQIIKNIRIVHTLNPRVSWLVQTPDIRPFYYAWVIVKSLGWVALFFALFGVLWQIKNDKRMALSILSFPIVYALYKQSVTFKQVRYLVPVLIVILIYAGLGFSMVTRLSVFKKRHLKPLPYLLLGFVLIAAGINSIRHDIFLSKVDTRTMAKEWIENNIPSGKKIALEAFQPSVPLEMSTSFFENKLRERREVMDSPFAGKQCEAILDYRKRFPPKAEYDLILLGEYAEDYDFGGLINEGVHYFVINSYNYEAFRKEPLKFPVQKYVLR